MADRNHVIELLDASGAKYIGPKGSGHFAYKLPSGESYIIPNTPSCAAAWNNSLSVLKQKLRVSHPHLMYIGTNYTPSKSRRTSIGEALAAKGTSLSIADEMSADSLKQDMRPAPITVEEPKEEVKAQAETIIPSSLRREPVYRSAVKTLTAEQLTEANRILKEQSQREMDEYIDKIHAGLVIATPEVQRAKEQTPGEFDMANGVSNLVAQAEAALVTCNAKVTELKSQLETEEINKMQLEGFLSKYAAFVKESADVLAILPKQAPAMVQAIQSKPEKKGQRELRKSDQWYSINDVRNLVVPELVKRHRYNFSTEDVLGILGKMVPDKQSPGYTKMYSSLYYESRLPKAAFALDAGHKAHFVLRPETIQKYQ